MTITWWYIHCCLHCLVHTLLSFWASKLLRRFSARKSKRLTNPSSISQIYIPNLPVFSHFPIFSPANVGPDGITPRELSGRPCAQDEAEWLRDAWGIRLNKHWETWRVSKCVQNFFEREECVWKKSFTMFHKMKAWVNGSISFYMDLTKT